VSLKWRISNIGWYNFELLVQTLLKVVIGPGVTSFGGSKDKGRDAAFVGPAAFPATTNKWTGSWVFQVKYVDFEEQGVDAARSSLKSTFRDELRRLLPLGRKIDNYILLTDVPLTTQTRDDLKEITFSHGFEGNFAIVDGKEICQFLDIHGDIRKSYPQLLGLADLEMIVNRDLYARSKAYLEKWQPTLATYVQTEAHTKALSLLRKKYFIVLDGAPEAGKSTIAASLALIYAADGFEIIDVRSPNDVYRVPNDRVTKRKKEERRTLFVADDAIGSISLVPGWANEWSRDLPAILRQLNSNRLLVWTARRYILEEALATSRLKDAAAGFPRPHEVLVEVGKLSAMQKAEMLYNHAKHANLDNDYRKLIRTHAVEIVNHPNFSPLRIHDLTSVILGPTSDHPHEPSLDWQGVCEFLKNPGEKWIQAFNALSQSEQTLLLSMLDFDGPVEARALRSAYERRATQRDGGHLSFEECVSRLDHSFLTVTSSHAGEQYVSVQHPSLRDMLLMNLRGDPNARRRYISLSSPIGLAGIIGGIAEFAESETLPRHSVVPTNEEEFDLFLDRLRSVSQSVLTLSDWVLLFAACERLIPQKPKTTAESTPAIDEFWKFFGEKPPAERVGPVDMDLEGFALNQKGRIIHAVLTGFSSRHTFENAQRFRSEDWARLLASFYSLTAYLSPPLYPSFTSLLCSNLSDSAESVRLASLIHSAEPLVVKQRITPALLEQWKDDLNAKATELIEQGDGFGHRDDPYEFDEWHSTSEEFLSTLKGFAQWGTPTLAKTIDELSQVLESASRPREREPDEVGESSLPETGPYWTIQRLFEDL